MAGSKNNGFAELISPFLRKKIAEAEATYGRGSVEAQALTKQYVYDQREEMIRDDERRRHYESEIQVYFENRAVVGVERLYRRTILIEPTTVCAAHCRWCLRGQYPVRTMREEEIVHATRYIGSEALRDDIDEVLITGGDPLMSQPLLALTLSELERNAPNVRTVRIGSRVIFQDPRRINVDLMAIFSRYPNFRLEIGVNVNHPTEFWPEAVDAVQRLQGHGIRMYNQHPLLKGVNDEFSTLADLYGLLRKHNIEPHYLFHAIPLRGMSHHRTSLRKGAALAAKLSSCGEFSGRAKPKYAVLSDIGKIVIYDGVILKHRESDNALLLQSGFLLADRTRWVPNWRPPASVEVDEEGLMRTWYLDGTDD
ncbi:MAG: radical SAM protein [Alphaproteobacteria bacterium]|nr:radical SAM protein [Alphaproteobacteria bacterium]